MTYRVLCADALEALAAMPDDSIDALVTDPPAGIAFMGKAWDHDKGGRQQWIAWMESIMREALRALKPGAHGLVWALPRTAHWTMVALEDAGFEVRDVILHLFGSGFPKSQNVAKHIDKMHGAQREKKRVEYGGELMRTGGQNTRPWMEKALARGYHELDGDVPVTDDAQQWEGWGTALKPASEHWILVRKPLAEDTIAANVLKWGTGAININASRIAHSEDAPMRIIRGKSSTFTGSPSDHYTQDLKPEGRWPANVVLSHTFFCEQTGTKQVRSDGNWRGDHKGAEHRIEESVQRENGMETVEVWECTPDCPVRLLDEQSGTLTSGKPNGTSRKATFGYNGGGHETTLTGYGDSGGASRFFFVAKPSSAEKHEALKKLSLFDQDPESKPKKNEHPTVKPVDLMRYFVRMVTPPGGTVLDCFGGSGTTGIAAIQERRDVVLIEREPDYAHTAEVRMSKAAIEHGA